MTTPFPQSGSVSFSDNGPSSSLLRQLLDEINGRGNPRGIHARDTPQNTPTYSANPHDSRARTSSVWIGGATIAQDARDKLRAADEARCHKACSHGADGTPDSPGSSSCFLTLGLHCPSSPTSKSKRGFGQSESNMSNFLYEETFQADAHNVKLGSPGVLSQRPRVGGLRLPSLVSNTQPLGHNKDSSTTESPLIFCDVDSNMSSTSSPTEPPTSAVTEASTAGTMVSDGYEPSCNGCLNKIPVKRTLSPSASNDMSSKRKCRANRSRSQTRTLGRSKIIPATLLAAVGDNNDSLTQGSASINNAPTSSDPASQIGSRDVPGLSSARLGSRASFQGDPQPSSSARTSPRRASMPERDSSPDPPETPSFARPLHLIDTDISIYRHDHGEDWRDTWLCLPCFRQHGSFNRILTHGYEVCGREEILDSHFWEPAVNPYT
ncbi:hypothetical protein BKA66DRAFT_437984 [Pyrenochaeta sp. MPI-SDFR-AT-0127]|nr:hypothetical protein BKA66DRAFT_437984 [Pyrenochaeta sp. MPI-SDFR-AT-0127]